MRRVSYINPLDDCCAVSDDIHQHFCITLAAFILVYIDELCQHRLHLYKDRPHLYRDRLHLYKDRPHLYRDRPHLYRDRSFGYTL